RVIVPFRWPHFQYPGGATYTNSIRTKARMLFVVPRLCRSLAPDTQKLDELVLIEPDNHVVADEDDRNAHLAALINHLLALLHVGCNVMLRVCDVVLLEELLAHLAEVTGGGGVNSDGLIHRSLLYCSPSIPN